MSVRGVPTSASLIQVPLSSAKSRDSQSAQMRAARITMRGMACDESTWVVSIQTAGYSCTVHGVQLPVIHLNVCGNEESLLSAHSVS